MTEHSIRVLLVEDDEAPAKVMRRAFAAASELFQLAMARRLREARPILSTPPDLVIADYLLPDAQGTELIRQGDVPAPYPVLILTRHGSEKLVVEALKGGSAGLRGQVR